MALVGDLVSILKEIKTKADTITIDAIWKELHSNEPLIEQLSGKEKQPQKRRSVKMVIPEEMKKLKRRSVGPVDSIGNIEKTKTVVFESAKDPNLFTFTKREVPPIQPRASPLSKLVGHVVFSEIKVFLPNEQKPVLVKIAQTAIFEKLIIMAVKKYNSQTPPPSTLLPEDPDAYMLRVADEKGNIDEDFPPVSTKQTVGKLSDYFVLTLKKATAPASSNRIIIKILMPNDTHITMAFDPDCKMAKVLKKCCKKRQLPEHEYLLQSVSDSTYISKDLKVSELKDSELRLVRKTDIQTQEVDGEIFWYDALARQYKTYNVVYHKKLGFKQDRILGIDGERITYTVIKKKGATKQLPPSLIKDIKSVTLDDKSSEKPTHFTIEFKTKDSRPVTYEAPNHAVAREIVGKLQYLLNMENKGGTNK